MTSPIHTTARLADLTLHRFNPRQTHDPDDIAALAKSIVINGLMQNLNVFNEDGQLGVVAGGRRLRALEYLRDHGTDIEGGIQIDFDAIPARITTDPALAHKWAGSEGATQRPLHPAEEIRAYAAMAEQGNGADIIAMAYGQTETHVKRRLKLARLSDAALDALRDNKITLDVAKVLTLTDSPQREMAMLELAADRNYSPARLRQELTEGKVTATDRRVKYITLLLYLAEGGAMDEDLFSDASLLHDRDLIDSLFKIKLTKAAEDIK
ncbi:MAG: ParB/RepB/Spo0J family partition protein, partial [Paracoccaceae bacterium]